jgi:uncharacterized membrane protein YkvA (DUF1232 family)
MPDRLKDRVHLLKAEVIAIYFAAKDPRTPWYAKALVFFVVAYALSPIDLIPDFIPVLGYLDDLIIIPGGLWAAVRLIPPEVLAEARAAAAAQGVDRRAGMVGVLLTLVLWIMAFGAAVFLLLYFTKRI